MSEIPSILVHVPVDFWSSHHSKPALPDFKGLPFCAEKPHVRYDGVLEHKEMSSLCAAGYFLWRHDVNESEVYVLMVVEDRKGDKKLGFPGGKRDSSHETRW